MVVVEAPAGGRTTTNARDIVTGVEKGAAMRDGVVAVGRGREKERGMADVMMRNDTNDTPL